MSAISDNEMEADVISRNLCGVVDIGSNAVRFSISSRAPHHSRIMPCVFKDKLGVSLFAVQYPHDSMEQCPIPAPVIKEVCLAMQRFKLICEDFGVPQRSVRVIGTQTVTEAINAKEFVEAVRESTGWEVDLLSLEDEGSVEAYSVISSSDTVSGFLIDMGIHSCILSWIKSVDGEATISKTAVSLPYGTGVLAKRCTNEDRMKLFLEIKQAFKEAFSKIGIPQDMLDVAEINGGFDLFTSGGGLRCLGHLLLSQLKEYPIQTIINGFSCSFEEFSSVCDYLFLKNKLPGNNETKIFKVSERRAAQLPSTGLLMSAASEAFPKIKSVHFVDAGIREGTLYEQLPKEIRAQDPLIIATRPYAPLLAEKYLSVLRSALPEDDVPFMVYNRIAPALCNLAFVHSSYPKELQPTAALHVATSGIISGTHGLSHRVRAMIGIALCDRWGGDIPDTEITFMRELEEIVLRDGNKNQRKRIIWWTKYIGTIMFVVCGVHPGGNIRDGYLDFKIRQVTEPTHLNNKVSKLTIDEKLARTLSNNKSTRGAHPDSRSYEVIVKIGKDDLKTSASVRARIITLQKKIRRLSKGSLDKVRVGIQFNED
ncbi:hypothetical protein TBLA_0I03520 [Henningerozyma blattae CBS 6284]|uniref:Uncharacterized protein n=1 Tax=Henningerozyma blattae (strain ATCC 34711 / CBS 6284 / DSM 70876 / NBRC 10599 / NRRL Y-10934 / UCD 77-7) TaxID=1071380 RepID=I2H9F3_HENB6|nr:hypothetical protein TBLA_0I03520 [Tetrapisispora blattae CBS 6284]CCH63005.1 hypothetical protein TBLA_0I03520 [Tetrapisispora blattae CBS 6284]